ncbi:MAG: type II toxin-antitoxin system RelE/ParE family toxin [Polyangiaceae bacterium]|nr:type II toxin-antitoxin system RelE/ParE family toxin [Polyangiaceae bacterium]
MKVFISKRARQAAERIDARWRASADHPDTFAQEFLAAVDFLESEPAPGSPFPTTRRPGLKRFLLPKAHCHIYFDVDETQQVIRVLHVWDGRREKPPKL